MNDSLKIIESVIIESLEKRRILAFIKFYGLYNDIVFHHIKNLFEEIRTANTVTIEKYKNSTHGKKRKNRKPLIPKDWASDLKSQFTRNRDRTNKFQKSLKKSMPKNPIERYLIFRTIKYISKKYTKRLDKVLATTANNNP